ncbi:nicotinate-nucleotide adenylyltransferase [Haloimpatiens lingqiaonensis]|uniref:nicotinate-nucleotide adenylyltransferase n=1 Tax=Haloimpatiens lingqiaonensis TaxID=1380675 RepID=UPI0010FD3443|nr:nicotinate-nucleotide adenylyltransferase [Haloimpatiens lingqiaonensis]
MTKKAIFGGTFDPIHIGHLYIAYQALYKLNLDKIIFVPSGNPPHKTERIITDSKLRYHMIFEAIKGEKNFELSSYEIEKRGLSYSYETIEYFKNSEKDTEWYFITGVDCLMEIETWKNVDDILSNCKFIVFNRPGYNICDILKWKEFIQNKYKKNIEFLDIPLLDISSTEIKNMIKNGQEVYYLLPKGVDEYIKHKELYI